MPVAMKNKEDGTTLIGNYYHLPNPRDHEFISDNVLLFENTDQLDEWENEW